MRPSPRRLIASALFLSYLFAAPTRAAEYFWNPGTGSGNWVSGNWSTPTNAAPYMTNWADNNTANFTAANQTITVNSIVTATGINFIADGIQVAAGAGSLFVVGSVPVSVIGSNTATIAENMSSVGAGSTLVKQGSGTLVLSGTNDISTVTVSAGTLRLGSNSAINSGNPSPAMTVSGTLDLAGFSTSRGGTLSGSGTILNSVAATTSTLTVGTGGSSSNFGGVIQDAAGKVALTKTGSGTLTLGSANAYTGVTTINDGTLVASALSDGLGSIGTSAVAIDGGTLRFTGGGTTTNRGLTIGAGGATLDSSGTGGLLFLNAVALSGSGARTLTLTGTTTFGSNGLSGGISDAGGATSLTKSGSNVWLIGGFNDYTGTTNVTAGGLYFNGTKSGTGAVTVSSGATLGGTGTIAGATTLTSATLDIGNYQPNPINSPTGVLTFSNNLSVTSTTAKFDFRRNGGNIAGSGYDQLVYNGSATLNLAGLTLDAQIRNNTTTQNFSTGMRIVNAGAGNLSGTFTGLADGATVTNLNGFAGFSSWFIDYDYVNGDVFLVPVPEPASVLGIAAAGLGLVRWVRRRRPTPSAPVDRQVG